MDRASLTPMLRQYFEIKAQHPDALLFFRLGDFYEMLFDDARTAAPVLEVVLTSRNKGSEDSVPMCGIPHHAMENYAAKLLRQGFKIAICDQVEDPSLAKGLVRREVTRVLTPGTALEIDGAGGAGENRVAALYRDLAGTALAISDLDAGECQLRFFAPGSEERLRHELVCQPPREILVPAAMAGEFATLRQGLPELEAVVTSELDDSEFNRFEGEVALKEQFGLATVEGLGLLAYPTVIGACGALLRYLTRVRRQEPKNLSVIRFNPVESHLILDPVTFRNLEIVANLRTGTVRGSLLDSVDQTLTPMGRRLLRSWLTYPLLDRREIERRLDGVEEFAGNLIVRSELRRLLKGMGDLARLTAKVALGVATPPHLLALRVVLDTIPRIHDVIASLRSAVSAEIAAGLDPLGEITSLIERAIADDPPVSLVEGQVIRDGFHVELDELRALNRNAREVIAAMEREERERTGIASLKIRYNRVFGYYIEVTKPHLRLVPQDYQRKQTMVNAERFITAALKELEERILRAEERIVAIEQSLYAGIIGQIRDRVAGLNQNAELLARLDVLSGLGENAQRRNHCRPEIVDGYGLSIREGRHPVLEGGGGAAFIPNDLDITPAADQILLITGPNMGGKSTYLRQNALIVILAQAGCFVPAEKAQIGIVDRIFTRIGASDSLLEGKSTFLTEMIETAAILAGAGRRSLILLDEIGRGTSTFDGLSIAWAVVEYLAGMGEQPKVLFATHYHELTELGEILDRVANVHIAVREWQDQVVFLHKIVPGATDQSFGIHVGKIAGLPSPVIERAKEILLNLEKKELTRLVKERLVGQIPQTPPRARSLFPEDRELRVWDEIRGKLAELDIARLTPLEALNLLHVIKLKSDGLK